MNGLKLSTIVVMKNMLKVFVDYHKGTQSEQSKMEEASDYNG